MAASPSVLSNASPKPPAALVWSTRFVDRADRKRTRSWEISDVPFSFPTYDAWNMMVGLYSGITTVAKYQYDGRRFRTVKLTYTSGTLSETRDFFYTAGWQNIEEWVAGVTNPQIQYVWAPVSMVEGGIQYIDQLICRDDATPARLYACQDANFNLTSITNTSGSVVERYLLDPYGTRTIMNASWTVIGSSAYGWVIAHQGLMLDVESGLLSNRGRILDAGLGRPAQRDPEGYVDGTGLYEYAVSNPILYFDPSGSSTGATPGSPAWIRQHKPQPPTPPPSAPAPGAHHGCPRPKGSKLMQQQQDCVSRGGTWDSLANNLYKGSTKACFKDCLGAISTWVVGLGGGVGAGVAGGALTDAGVLSGAESGGLIPAAGGAAVASWCLGGCATDGCSLDQTPW